MKRLRAARPVPSPLGRWPAGPIGEAHVHVLPDPASVFCALIGWVLLVVATIPVGDCVAVLLLLG